MRLMAQLTMPCKGSWNGKWSGEDETYTKAFLVSKEKAKEILYDNLSKGKDANVGIRHTYAWGDGWVANVRIYEPRKGERETGKFYGYEWMIDSIVDKGYIMP
jgi:hypothetical protein